MQGQNSPNNLRSVSSAFDDDDAHLPPPDEIRLTSSWASLMNNGPIPMIPPVWHGTLLLLLTSSFVMFPGEKKGGGPGPGLMMKAELSVRDNHDSSNAHPPTTHGDGIASHVDQPITYRYVIGIIMPGPSFVINGYYKFESPRVIFRLRTSQTCPHAPPPSPGLASLPIESTIPQSAFPLPSRTEKMRTAAGFLVSAPVYAYYSHTLP
ncbi:hypothetical protein BP00DRAFT_114723 [Aspergillus indologenus CBS 114.80]|uniref:Uncharacterized protein n=1 Tax=Aspergillus indologenus CBS 114.80 TaxID=1450541 RepID=A0A2V5II39_9EURO|nr:hypothetical protein BP00DRAFT_114723 [Aspergillus indologenus CBS 114.80]